VQFGLTHDVLRHTFISIYRGEVSLEMGEAALQAQLEGIIRKPTFDLKSHGGG